MESFDNPLHLQRLVKSLERYGKVGTHDWILLSERQIK
jgi:hypothetical protein